MTLEEMINKTKIKELGINFQKKIIQKEVIIATKNFVLKTYIDGVLETKKQVKIGDYILIGSKGEKYSIEKEKFEKLYEKVNENLYKTKPDKVIAIELKENIKFIANWGEEMRGYIGDFLIYRSDDDIYRIERKAFFLTYEKTKKIKNNLT